MAIKYIRLDTGLDEKVVRKIYLDAGFKIVNIIGYDNGNSMALYELKHKFPFSSAGMCQPYWRRVLYFDRLVWDYLFL